MPMTAEADKNARNPLILTINRSLQNPDREILLAAGSSPARGTKHAPDLRFYFAGEVRRWSKSRSTHVFGRKVGHDFGLLRANSASGCRHVFQLADGKPLDSTVFPAWTALGCNGYKLALRSPYELDRAPSASRTQSRVVVGRLPLTARLSTHEFRCLRSKRWDGGPRLTRVPYHPSSGSTLIVLHSPLSRHWKSAWADQLFGWRPPIVPMSPPMAVKLSPGQFLVW
jgi:hypothetical protein